MICPCCGRESTFTHHEAVGTGGESDERFWDEWLVCGECGAVTSEAEIQEANMEVAI